MKGLTMALVPIALLLVVTFGVTGMGTAVVHSQGTAPQLVEVHLAVIVQASSTNSNSTGINGSSIWQSLYQMAIGFANSILKGIEGLISDILNGIGTSFTEVFQGWGFAVVSQTGIFAPLVMVAILAMTFFVLQMFMALYAGEKDVAEEVEDV